MQVLGGFFVFVFLYINYTLINLKNLLSSILTMLIGISEVMKIFASFMKGL